MTDVPIQFRAYLIDRDDRNRTVAKMEQQYMDKMGLKPGDIVKISGKDTAAAFCFPLTEDELGRTRLQDVQIEFLNRPDKKPEYPRIVLSNTTYCGACPPRRTKTVSVEKISSQSAHDKIPEATVVTLGTMDFASKAMPDYEENLDYSSLFGRLMGKKDRISIPFLPAYSQKQQHPSKTRQHPSPMFFQTVLVDAQPKKSEFWLITKDTKFEFQNVPKGAFRGLFPRHEAMDLKRVIPIVKRFHAGDSDILLASIEVYENTMNLKSYLQQRIKLPDDFLSNPAKVNDITSRMHPDSPEIVVEIRDDVGNLYSEGMSTGGGGSTGPDPSTGEIVSDRTQDYIFEQALDPKARELTVVVKEIQWSRRHTQSLKPTKPPHMTPTSSDVKITILEGPWEFTVPILR